MKREQVTVMNQSPPPATTARQMMVSGGAILLFLLLVIPSTLSAQPVPNRPGDGADNQPIELQLGWRPTKDADYFEVELDVSSDMTAPLTFLSDTDFVEVTNLLYTTQYYWHVRGLDAVGDPVTDWSTVQSFTTIPSRGIPQPLYPEDRSVDQPLNVSLEWSGVEGGLTYEVAWGSDPSFDPATTQTASVNGTEKILGGLAYSQTVYWHVRLMSAAGGPSSPWSRYFSFSTEREPVEELSAPRLLSPINGMTGAPIDLSFAWSEIEGKTITYDIEISSSPTFDSLAYSLYELDTTAAEITGLEANATFYWHVRAVSSFSQSPWSDVWNLTTRPDTLPGMIAPQLLTPTNGSTGLSLDLLLTWDSTERATLYEVEISRSSTFDSLEERIVVDSTSAESTDLLPGVTYYWHVRAMNSSEKSGWSRPFRFTTDREESLLPSTPRLIAPGNGTSDLEGPISLLWMGGANATAYFIQVSTTGEFNGEEEVMTMIDTTMILDDLAEGTTYHWRVQGINDDGESPWSDPWRFTTRQINTGVDAEHGKNQTDRMLILSPIPASDYLRLSLRTGGSSAGSRDGRWEIIDGPGRLMMEGSIGIEENLTIETSPLPPGLYFCRVVIDGKAFVRSFPVVR